MSTVGHAEADLARAPGRAPGRAPAPVDDVMAGCSPLAPLSALAVRHYDPALAYHHFGHALTAAQHGARLSELYLHAGVPVDTEVVQAALLYHDAGYSRQPLAHVAGCREQVAAQLADADLRRLHWSPQQRAHVTAAILATQHHTRGHTLRSAEERIVRAADIAGLAGPYEGFARDNRNVRAEAFALDGQAATDADWATRTLSVIGSYLAERLHPAGLSVALDEEARRFQRVGQANLDRYGRSLHAAA